MFADPAHVARIEEAAGYESGKYVLPKNIQELFVANLRNFWLLSEPKWALSARVRKTTLFIINFYYNFRWNAVKISKLCFVF